jgi:hypothetical protein
VALDNQICDFEMISTSGKSYFSALPEEKESWKRSLQEAIEKAQKGLLGSAFHLVTGSGKQFQVSFSCNAYMTLATRQSNRKCQLESDPKLL